MLVLRAERIPHFQWILMVFLSLILLVNLTAIQSAGDVLAAALKTAFAGSIVFVFVMLHKLEELNLFDKIVGQESAEDVIEILDGKK